MWVAISVGNTNVAWAPVAGGRLLGPRRLAPWRSAGATSLEGLLADLVDRPPTVDRGLEGLVAASVVPAADRALERLAAAMGARLVRAGPESVPIAVRVDRPAAIGSDRLVNAYACGRLHGTPAIVVDLGTATTVDAVAADGGFLGGAIAAGPQLGLDALAERTALLPRVELREVDAAIGRDTISAMLSGATFGQLGLVSELVERMRGELQGEAGGRSIVTVATGGHAGAAWAAGLPVDVVDPDLTLAGLALLAQDAAGIGAGALGPHGRDTGPEADAA